MKKKIIIIITASFLLLSNIYSQQPRLGFTGGIALSNYKVKPSVNSENGDMKAGFTLGMIVNVPLGKNLAIQPGMNWVQKGTKSKETMGSSTSKTTLCNNYIEVSADLLYNFSGFFVGAGPSASYAAAGKWKTKSDDKTEEEDVKFGSSEKDDMKVVDFGVNILAGYQLPGGILFSATFNKGLRNLVNADTDDVTLKSYYFAIRLGYLIKGKGN